MPHTNDDKSEEHNSAVLAKNIEQNLQNRLGTDRTVQSFVYILD